MTNRSSLLVLSSSGAYGRGAHSTAFDIVRPGTWNCDDHVSGAAGIGRLPTKISALLPAVAYTSEFEEKAKALGLKRNVWIVVFLGALEVEVCLMINHMSNKEDIEGCRCKC